MDVSVYPCRGNKVLTMAEYIEREALMRRIKENHCAECDDYHGVRCRACWVDDTLDYIDSETAADVECGGRLRGVTYEDGKVTAVHIRDTDDAVKVFAPVRRGRWKYYRKQGIAVCTWCSFERKLDDNFGRAVSCPNCGAKMDLEE